MNKCRSIHSVGTTFNYTSADDRFSNTPTTGVSPKHKAQMNQVHTCLPVLLQPLVFMLGRRGSLQFNYCQRAHSKKDSKMDSLSFNKWCSSLLHWPQQHSNFFSLSSSSCMSCGIFYSQVTLDVLGRVKPVSSCRLIHSMALRSTTQVQKFVFQTPIVVQWSPINKERRQFCCHWCWGGLLEGPTLF